MVKESVQTAASYAYPADLIVHAYQAHPLFQQLESTMEQLIPYELKAVMAWRGEKALGERQNEEDAFTLEPSDVAMSTVKAFVWRYVDRRADGTPYLQEERLSITNVQLPTFQDEARSIVGITAEYRIRLPIPFIKKEIVLVESAYERCWVANKAMGGGQ